MLQGNQNPDQKNPQWPPNQMLPMPGQMQGSNPMGGQMQMPGQMMPGQLGPGGQMPMMGPGMGMPMQMLPNKGGERGNGNFMSNNNLAGATFIHPANVAQNEQGYRKI